MCLVKGKWKPNEFKADIKHFAQQTKLKVNAVSQFPQPSISDALQGAHPLVLTEEKRHIVLSE